MSEFDKEIHFDRIYNHLEEFSNYYKQYKDYFRIYRNKTKNFNVDYFYFYIEFENPRNDKLRLLKFNEHLKYKFFDENKNEIKSSIMDDVEISEILNIVYNFKTNIEKIYNYEYTGMQKDINFYKQDKKLILEYKSYLLFTDNYKKIDKIIKYDEVITDYEKEEIKYLIEEYKYFKSIKENKSIIEYKGNKLVKVEDIKNEIKNRKEYKIKDFIYNNQLLVFSTSFIFMVLNKIFIMPKGVFSDMVFATLMIGLILFFIIPVDESIRRYVDFSDFYGLDNYIDLDKNYMLLEKYKILKNDELILSEKSQPLLIEQPKQKSVNIKIINNTNEDLKDDVYKINEYIKLMNEKELINENDLINKYYIPEINDLIQNYNELNENYKNKLKENIELLINKFELILKDTDLNQKEIAIDVMNKKLKES